MTIDIENGRRFNEEPLLAAVNSGDDIILVRLANGTGVKSIKLDTIKSFIQGDLSELDTEDKTSVIAAINEVFGLASDNADNIEILDGLIEALKTDGATRANALPYEHDLGTELTAEQSSDIRSGKFKLVKTGGYWTINGRKYWAGHADYRLHCGDTELTTHHMLVFPDRSLYNGVMNDSNVVTGGYYGSKMKTSGLANALATIKADFGADHVLTHRQLLTNAAANGAASGWAWYDSQIDLMNESMVYGHEAWSSAHGYDTGIDKSQLALFQARPDLITNRENWWLRDIVSATYFALVSGGGYAFNAGASASFGVRPAFLIY